MWWTHYGPNLLLAGFLAALTFRVILLVLSVK